MINRENGKSKNEQSEGKLPAANVPSKSISDPIRAKPTSFTASPIEAYRRTPQMLWEERSTWVVRSPPLDLFLWYELMHFSCGADRSTYIPSRVVEAASRISLYHSSTWQGKWGGDIKFLHGARNFSETLSVSRHKKRVLISSQTALREGPLLPRDRLGGWWVFDVTEYLSVRKTVFSNLGY